MLVFDIETDGLLLEATKVHCLNAIDLRTGREYRYTDNEYYYHASGQRSKTLTPRDGTIADGLRLMRSVDGLAGHNILGYDLPVLERLYGFTPRPETVIRDTQVMASVMYTNISDVDFGRIRKGQLPQSFVNDGHVGRHTLRAWALRVGGVQKAEFVPNDYSHTWATVPFLKDMDDYCMDDVRASVDVLKFLESKEYSEECLQLEHDVKRIVTRQEQHGWLFDTEGAIKLSVEFQAEAYELEEELRQVFPPWFMRDGKTKKYGRTAKVWVQHEMGAHTHPKKGERGYYSQQTLGAERQPIKLVMFNPGSTNHIASRLKDRYGWEPTEFTPSGQPKLDDEIIRSLPYEEAPLIAKYLKLKKRLGQLSEGKQAWLKQVRDNGRIHGSVRTNGAVTGRMTHSHPNVAQADKMPEVRALFTVPAGKKQVGCDADGLELRMLGHYMAHYDKGEYVKIVLDGRKEDGTDIHTRNQKAVGLNSRDSAKTWIYAFLYGAQNFMLGTIVLDDMTKEQKAKFYSKYPEGEPRNKGIARLGQISRDRMEQNFPALEKLVKQVKARSKSKWLRGLDGRQTYVRSRHSALNTLLQGAGAIVMKKGLVILDDTLRNELGLVPGRDYEFAGNIHDEWQLEVSENLTDLVGGTAASAIKLAGEHYGLRCPLAGSFDVGESWADTH